MTSGEVPANTAKPSPIENLLSNFKPWLTDAAQYTPADCHDRAPKLDEDAGGDHHRDGDLLRRPPSIPAARRRRAAALHGTRARDRRRSAGGGPPPPLPP